MEKEKIIKTLSKRIGYLNEYIENSMEIVNSIPALKDMLDMSELDLETFQQMPNDGEELIPPGLSDEYENVNVILFSNLPMPPVILSPVVNSTDVIVTSGSTGAFTTVTRGLDFEDYEINKWASQEYAKYRELQIKQSRYEIVIERLEILNPDRANELRDAQQKYTLSKTKTEDKVDAGIWIRNVLEHFKGDILQFAKTSDKENTPSWEEMSQRLTGKTTTSFECSELIKQKVEWKRLHKELTNIAKNRNYAKNANLEKIWIEFVDHLFIVLGLINL